MATTNSTPYKIASLSDKGWVSDSRTSLGYMFNCYILTDVAQTLLFGGKLISLPETYHRFINDPPGMANQIVSDLSKLLGYYFPHVDVRARSKQISGSQYGIIMEVTVLTDTGERIQLAKLVELNTDGIRKNLDIINYGDLESSYV